MPPTAYPVRTDNGIIGEDFIAKCSASYGQPGILRSANQCQCAWDRLSEEYDQITLSNINWNGLDGDYYMDKVKDDCPAGA